MAVASYTPQEVEVEEYVSEAPPDTVHAALDHMFDPLAEARRVFAEMESDRLGFLTPKN